MKDIKFNFPSEKQKVHVWDEDMSANPIADMMKLIEKHKHDPVVRTVGYLEIMLLAKVSKESPRDVLLAYSKRDDLRVEMHMSQYDEIMEAK